MGGTSGEEFGLHAPQHAVSGQGTQVSGHSLVPSAGQRIWALGDSLSDFGVPYLVLEPACLLLPGPQGKAHRRVAECPAAGGGAGSGSGQVVGGACFNGIKD